MVFMKIHGVITRVLFLKEIIVEPIIAWEESVFLYAYPQGT